MVMFNAVMNYLLNKRGMSELSVWKMFDGHEKSVFLSIAAVFVFIESGLIYLLWVNKDKVSWIGIVLAVILLCANFAWRIERSLHDHVKKINSNGTIIEKRVGKKLNPTQGDFIKATVRAKFSDFCFYVLPVLICSLCVYVYLYILPVPFLYVLIAITGLVVYYVVLVIMRKNACAYSEWYFHFAHEHYDDLLSDYDSIWLSDADNIRQKENLLRYHSYKKSEIFAYLMTPLLALCLYCVFTGFMMREGKPFAGREVSVSQNVQDEKVSANDGEQKMSESESEDGQSAISDSSSSEEQDIMPVDGYTEEESGFDEAAAGEDNDPFCILSERKLTEEDLYGKSSEELSIMRNYIYARHGYRFKRKDLLNHFSQYSWYTPQTGDMTAVYNGMSGIECYNIEFIKKRE